nr:hypothetical protein [Kibdelosporangium sp. MJ126-NF4]CTQ93089.1 hypothetical protein [Kibdelosporangium sp. MJ126-NF4]
MAIATLVASTALTLGAGTASAQTDCTATARIEFEADGNGDRCACVITIPWSGEAFRRVSPEPGQSPADTVAGPGDRARWTAFTQTTGPGHAERIRAVTRAGAGHAKGLCDASDRDLRAGHRGRVFPGRIHRCCRRPG